MYQFGSIIKSPSHFQGNLILVGLPGLGLSGGGFGLLYLTGHPICNHSEISAMIGSSMARRHIVYSASDRIFLLAYQQGGPDEFKRVWTQHSGFFHRLLPRWLNRVNAAMHEAVKYHDTQLLKLILERVPASFQGELAIWMKTVIDHGHHGVFDLALRHVSPKMYRHAGSWIFSAWMKGSEYMFNALLPLWTDDGDLSLLPIVVSNGNMNFIKATIQARSYPVARWVRALEVACSKTSSAHNVCLDYLVQHAPQDVRPLVVRDCVEHGWVDALGQILPFCTQEDLKNFKSASPDPSTTMNSQTALALVLARKKDVELKEHLMMDLAACGVTDAPKKI